MFNLIETFVGEIDLKEDALNPYAYITSDGTILKKK
jgi:hypothetical protein